jgi:hypothetical protein
MTGQDTQYFEYMCGMQGSWQLTLLKWLKIVENIFPNLIAFNILIIFYIFGVIPIEVIQSYSRESDILILTAYSKESED